MLTSTSTKPSTTIGPQGVTQTPELKPLRFIPFRRADILAMCRAERGLDERSCKQFETASQQIESFYRQDFYTLKQQLKDAYAPVDPDADTRRPESLENTREPADLQSMLDTVLNRANYEKVTKQGAGQSAALIIAVSGAAVC